MDQFVQTQNDGKIVVAEYARNIGKVASAAAALNVPLSKSMPLSRNRQLLVFKLRLRSLALSGTGPVGIWRSSKGVEGTGLQIDAASVAADGLVGTLRRCLRLALIPARFRKRWALKQHRHCHCWF